MESGNDTIRALAEPIAAELGLEIFDVELLGKAPRLVVRIYLDSPDATRAVTVADCEAVSLRVSDVLDAHEAVEGRYLLEVSSPGINRPLRTRKHFVRAVGNRVRLRLRETQGRERNVYGRLVAVGEEQLTIESDSGERLTCLFESIERANVEHDFGEGAKTKRRQRIKRGRS